jgi:predicted nucleic acid-binding protein
VIFDTDVLIWIQRGNVKAANLIDDADSRFVSIQTYMELLQGARNKTQHKLTKKYFTDLGFVVLPFTENIGHRALIYVEEYTLSSGLFAADAIIAATAVENNMKLCSANEKHFKAIKDLDFQVFKP